MSNHIALQQEAFEANMQLPKLGLVLFTFGNVSVADREKARDVRDEQHEQRAL